jgi:homogentisate 1,2-dioxygenase
MGEGYIGEIYSLKGFFGEWAHMYRRHNPAHPVRWSDDRLMYSGLDPSRLTAEDGDDPRGMPLRLLEGEGIAVSISRRSAPMPFGEKNLDANQIRFYHRGSFRLDTELGVLDVKAGDFVVIPRGLIFRETPLEATGNVVYIWETDAVIQTAESLWDSVAYSGLFIDYSEMALPEPDPLPVETSPAEHEVRVRYDGRWHSMIYDFDPCRDVVGWVGDPVIFKMNVWDVPTPGTTHGTLPPPAGAVLLGENKEFAFNVLSMPPLSTVPPPQGSFGPPAHQNDYDEVWLTHASEHAPESEGHLWLLPATIPHPGLKQPEAPPVHGPVMTREINFDTKVRLWWTADAQDALFDDPVVAKYTSSFGVPLAVAPDYVQRRAAANTPGA